MFAAGRCVCYRAPAANPALQRHLPELPVPSYKQLSQKHRSWHRTASTVRRCKQGSTDAPQAPNRLNQEPPADNPASTSNKPATAGSQRQPHQPAKGNENTQASNSPAPPSAAEEIDQQLSGVWDDLKREMRKDLDPDTAKLLDSMSYEDLTGSNAKQFFRKLASSQLGPILAAMGLNVDPFDFLIEMVKLAAFLQFITCGMLWFGSQSVGHFSTGEAATATVGLALGYLSRPAFKMELLLYPVYNGMLQLFLPNATYMVPPSSRPEVQGMLNRLGITLALCFLLPQLLWGWDGSDSTVFVVPLCAGWFLFDLTYMMGLLLLLQQTRDD